MEQLALTCKVLYDKDYLDNIKLLKKSKYNPVIKYDCHHKIYNNISRFQCRTFLFISEQLDNENDIQELITNMDLLQSSNIFIKNLKDFIKKELMIHTMNKHMIWVKILQI